MKQAILSFWTSFGPPSLLRAHVRLTLRKTARFGCDATLRPPPAGGAGPQLTGCHAMSPCQPSKRTSRARQALLLCLALAAPAPALAQPAVRVVGDDRGGPLLARVVEISTLQASGTRVEIRGGVCHSACTMYLGAGDVCVDPATEFGFHGPSGREGPLDAQAFEQWSEIMARHYKPALRRWFLEQARHQSGTVLRLQGSELIRLGYPSC